MLRRWPARLAAAGLALVAARRLAPRPHAVEANLSMQGVDDAIVFARMARRDARQAFHDRYVRTVGETVRRISLVSEYRRVVLLTEEHIRLGDRNYSVRQMTSDLKPWRGSLEVIVELAFHPQNTYVGVPLIDVLLVPLDDPATACRSPPTPPTGFPRFGLFWDRRRPTRRGGRSRRWPRSVTPRAEPVTGGWVQARFEAEPLAHGRFDVVVKEGAKTLGVAAFDFGALR